MTFEVVYNKALKIYSKLYVGVKPASGPDDVPLGFATPYTEDAAGLKRQSTVKGWVGTSTYDYKTRQRIEHTPDIRIVENKPRSGFKITDDVKRVYWGGGNVVWRLAHPDGWEIEIQSSNLMALIQAVGIEKDGVIPGQCVIARDGATNILLPVSSEEYKNAIKAAESIVKPGKIPMKDRIIGRMYRLQDGSFGRYLGKLWVTAQEHEYSAGEWHVPYSGQSAGMAHTRTNVSRVTETKQYEVMYIPEREETTYKYTHPPLVKVYASASIIQELDQESLTPEEALKLTKKVSAEWASSSKSGSPIAFSLTPGADVQYVAEPISDREFNLLRMRAQKQIEDAMKNYEANKGRETFNVSRKEVLFSLNTFLSIDRSVLLQDLADDGKFYRSGNRCFGNYRTLDEAKPTDVLSLSFIESKGKVFTTYDVLSNTRYYGYSKTAEEISTVAATLYSTWEELHKELEALHAAGRFVTITQKKLN